MHKVHCRKTIDWKTMGSRAGVQPWPAAVLREPLQAVDVEMNRPSAPTPQV